MRPPAVRREVLRSLLAVAFAATLSTIPFAPAPRAAELGFPETGTPAERARQLWTGSRTLILDDASAALTDAEYQKRRAPIWNAWTRLQMETAGEDAAVGRLIPDILGLINDTYGWTASSPAERQKLRDRKRRYTPENVAEIDARVKALK